MSGFSSGLYEIVTTGLTVNQFAYVPLVGVNPVRLTGADRFIKSLMDISLTVPGVIVLSPILLDNCMSGKNGFSRPNFTSEKSGWGEWSRI